MDEIKIEYRGETITYREDINRWTWQGANSDKVESNLRAVVEYGMRAERGGVSLETAMRDISKVR
jgi:hypothetical protein